MEGSTEAEKINVIQDNKPVCNRCGRCCHYLKNGIWKKCKNLIFLNRNTGKERTACRIWGNPSRLGTEIDEGIFCNRIESIPNTFVSCPFNLEKPLLLVKTKPYDEAKKS